MYYDWGELYVNLSNWTSKYDGRFDVFQRKKYLDMTIKQIIKIKINLIYI